jgi:TRAP-type C4-dicarboxylate transport system substrate-binding protein
MSAPPPNPRPHRRAILLGGIAATFAHPRPAAASEVWKIGTVVAPPSMLGILVDEMAAAIGAATGGALRAERYQQPNEQEIAQNVLRARYEMAYISATGLAPAIPEIGVLNMPFLWDSTAQRDAVTDRHVVPLVAQFLQNRGLTLLRFGEAGWTNLFCTTPCTRPEQLRGMRVRVSPTAGDRMMFERLGSNGATMTLADFYPALQQGVVHAGTLTFSFYLIGPAAQAAPHYVFTQHAHQPAFLVANTQRWNRVPADQRAAIERGLPTAAELRRRVEEDERPKMDLHRSRGGQVHILSEEERAAWSAAITPGHDGLVAGFGGRARELFEAIQQGKREFAAQGRAS